MKNIFDKAIKTKTISKKDLGKLLQYVNLPENRNKYYLNNETQEDRIGKFRQLVFNPSDKENQYTTKLYEVEDDRDPIIYKIQYYDLLRDEISYTKKAMLFYTLQKRIEMTYEKELKINEKTKEFEDIADLLDKVKKARSYFNFKMFLSDNKSGS